MPLGKSLGNILGDYFGEESVSLNGQPDLQLSVDGVTLAAKIPIKKIKLNPNQTRTQFAFEKIQSLSQSIKENGLIHPILVLARHRPDAEGGEIEYVLLAGERRLRACKLLGHEEILAIVKPQETLTSAQQAMLTAVENLQREDLTPVELAKTFAMLIQTQGLDELALAGMLGHSVQYVKNYLRLLTLSPLVQQALLERKIGEGQARYLVGLSPSKQEYFLRQILDKDLTVKEVQALVRREEMIQPLTKSKHASHNLKPELVSKAQKLAEQFPKAKLKCLGDEQKGRIVITWG